MKPIRDIGKVEDLFTLLKKPFISLTLGVILTIIAQPMQAEASDDEKLRHYSFRLFQRLVGVPPTSSEVDAMVEALKKDQIDEALEVALDAPEFYMARLAPWVKYWFNEDNTNRVPLNDAVATVIGVIRDDLPFTSILSEDILYRVANPQGTAALPAPSLANNTHYLNAESRYISLKENLVRTTQSAQYGINPSTQEIAGVYTTRGFGEAFYNAGTNRAAFEATMKHFFCKSMEELHDTSTPTFRIRQDVTRAPGGEPETFVNTCQGCHGGMDALTGAFAYFDFVDDRLVYDRARLQPNNPNSTSKFHNNADAFPQGFRTKDNSWINLWSEGQNASLGWRGATEGQGVKEFGELIAGARQFSSCMSEQIFELICLHAPTSDEEKNAVRNISYRFESQGRYSVKQVFKDTAKFCVAK